MNYISARVFTSVFFGFILSATTSTALAQKEVSVEIGKKTSFQLRRQVDADSVRVWVRYRNITKGRLDTSNNKFTIEGLNVGTTEMTFSGTYREIIVGGRIQERARPFTERFIVTVMPRTEAIDRQTRRIIVSAGYSKTYRASTYLGADFTNPNDEGYKWRNLRFNRGNDGIATIETNRARMNFTIRGIATGKTTIMIRGDKIFDGVWKTVIRDLEIVVGTGTTTENNPDPANNADATLARLNREFRALASRAGNAAGNENENRRLRIDLGLFADSVDIELARERGLLDPDEARVARLEKLFEDANVQIERLENNPTSETVNLTGVWVSGGKYSSCSETGVMEVIRITQTGNRITAVKIVGNPCIKAGEETFRGIFSQNPFDAEMRTRHADGSSPSSKIVRIFVRDQNTIEIRVDSQTVIMTRKQN